MFQQARYRDMLAFLFDGGARLSTAAPRMAAHLAERSKDPDVERLLEGVAYLAAQVDEKLDERVALSIQLAFDLFFPGYLSPMPAASVVELQADKLTFVPRGTEVGSIPIEG